MTHSSQRLLSAWAVVALLLLTLALLPRQTESIVEADAAMTTDTAG